MAAFEFQALDDKGKQKKGVLEADSPRQIRQQLRERQWTPLSVEKIKEKKQTNSVFNRGPSLKTVELALLTRQISTLIAASLPIEEALRAVAEQADNNKIKSIVLAIRAKVLEGHSFADSLSEFPQAFPNLYRSTVAAGEHAGHLDQVLNRLADYTENQQAVRQKIQLAAIYPMILGIVATVVVIGLLTFVVPDIVEAFSSQGQDLPGLTIAVIALSDFIVDGWLWMLIIASCAVGGFLYALTKPSILLKWHRFLLVAPLVGPFVRGTNISQFVSTLTILTTSGVPLVDALKIAGQVIGNIPIKNAIKVATQDVREGGNLHKALSETKQFPPMMLHMIGSGEASGELDNMLDRIAKHQQSELENRVTTMVSLFEPLMLVCLGGIVLLIVLAIMMPMLNLNQLVQ
jgi:general secretion pathway protein F